MTPRIENPSALFPAGFKAMVALETALRQTGIELELLELIKLRASQINGCAFCIHMHVTDLKTHGVADMKLHMLAAWRESTLYSDRERAALAWTEALTKLSFAHPSDADYAALAAAFTEEEQVRLSYAIGAINVWNRVQAGFRVAHPVEAAARAAA